MSLNESNFYKKNLYCYFVFKLISILQLCGYTVLTVRLEGMQFVPINLQMVLITFSVSAITQIYNYYIIIIIINMNYHRHL